MGHTMSTKPNLQVHSWEPDRKTYVHPYIQVHLKKKKNIVKKFSFFVTYFKKWNFHIF